MGVVTGRTGGGKRKAEDVKEVVTTKPKKQKKVKNKVQPLIFDE